MAAVEGLEQTSAFWYASSVASAFRADARERLFPDEMVAFVDGVEAAFNPFLPVDPFGPVMAAFMANETCCVDPFRYPIKGSVKPHTERAHSAKGRKRKAAHVGFKFKADAIFKQEDDGPCKCKCCEFRQKVEKIISIGQAGMMRTVNEPLSEDCLYWKPDPNNAKHADVVTTEGQLASAKAAAKKAGKEPPTPPAGTNKYCYGRKGQKRPPGLGAQGYTAGEGNEAKGDCYFWMEDKPGVEVSPGLVVVAKFKYEGTIIDVCNGDIEKEKKTFKLNFTGSVNPQTGDVTVSLTPGATPGLGQIDKPTMLPNPYKPKPPK